MTISMLQYPFFFLLPIENPSLGEALDLGDSSVLAHVAPVLFILGCFMCNKLVLLINSKNTRINTSSNRIIPALSKPVIGVKAHLCIQQELRQYWGIIFYLFLHWHGRLDDFM